MSRGQPMPYGPEWKDPLWRWGSFLVGVCGFVALLALATLGGVSLFGFWWFVALFLGIALSWRAGSAWRRGERPERHFSRQIQPTVDVRGQEGSTYVLMEPARSDKRVRPREFGPFFWGLYSLFVRAPVALGDVILTLGWRLLGGIGNGGTQALASGIQMEHVDGGERPPPPDSETF